MAKLNKAMQKQVDSSSSGFDPMPDGIYHFRLRDVDATRSGPAGPYWSWDYECVEEGHVGRRQWNNTSLSEKAAWKMKEAFTAHGVPLDTDTDEIIGGIVRLTLSTRTIQPPSPRAGEQTNQVDKVSPPDPDFQLPDTVADAAPGSSGGGPSAEEVIF